MSLLVQSLRGVSNSLAPVVLFAGILAVAGMAFAQSVPLVVPTPQGQAGGGQTGGGQSGAGQSGLTDPNAPVVRQVIVDGAQRIERATILSYIGLREGDRLDARGVDQALKTLFATGLFADVTMQMTGDTLAIRVVENPIINRIAFEGNGKLNDEVLSTETQLRPRVVYTRTRVQNDVKRILDLYRRRGRFAAQVEPKVIQLDQNRVDLVFEIREGPLTGVKTISFIGNSFFSDSALRGELITKESRWYRFFSASDTYDPDKLTFDRELLRRFYLSEGFADFRVASAVAELTEDRDNFFITFTIDEGARYTFGDFAVTSRIPDIDAESLLPLIKLESGDWYNADSVEDTITILTNAVGDQGYAFVDIRPKVSRNRDTKIIDITFEILEAPRVFVERIDVRGNVRTLDEVVRREFQLVEGDAFNSSKLRRSRQRITNLGFFSSVEVNNVPGSSPDKTVIQVDVEEQSTGDLSIGAGLSSNEGLLGEISIRERNLLGRGQDLRISTTLSQRTQFLDFAFTEPYFLDRDLAAGFDLFHVERDNQDVSSYDSTDTGFGLRLGFDLNEDWRQSVRYRFAQESIDNVGSDANQFIQAEEGSEFVSSVGQTLTYDTRNSRISPTEGYSVSLANDVAGLGGSVRYLRSTVSAEWYFPVTDTVLFSTRGRVGSLLGLGDGIRVSDRFFLGGDNLRGFEEAGASPRDQASDDAVGGEQLATGTVEMLFPLGLPEEFGIKGAVFADMGYLAEVDEDGTGILENNSIRVGVGTGLAWQSPFGPIRVDFSHAAIKEDYDETEFFRFNFGTTF